MTVTQLLTCTISVLLTQVIESGTQKQILTTYKALIDALEPVMREASLATDSAMQADADAAGPLSGAYERLSSMGQMGFNRLSLSQMGGKNAFATPRKGSSSQVGGTVFTTPKHGRNHSVRVLCVCVCSWTS